MGEAQLREEQAKTLSTPFMKSGLLAKLLFVVMDLFYRRARSWSKFKVLEVIARVPYQAWERVAYIAITHAYQHEDFARRIFDRVQESRRNRITSSGICSSLRSLCIGGGSESHLFSTG